MPSGQVVPPELERGDTEFGDDLGRGAISTGFLPEPDAVDTLLRETYDRYLPSDEGQVADYIPALAAADPGWFALSVAVAGGRVHSVGCADRSFSIQSISKAFVFALVCEHLGHLGAWKAVGVNNTGLPFDSVMAMELNGGAPMNPMVNAGALVTTGLVPGDSAAAKWTFVQDGLSAFAGRCLELDITVYESEAATNQRNRGIARLLESYGRMAFDPLETTDVYTRQCSLTVSTRDLAVMGATLADGGMNPLTGVQVVAPGTCRRVLAAMAASGLYERSGDWLYDIGLPGKSGVSGGIVAVAPGKGALASFSPPLDTAGNSVRGQRAARHLSRTLGLNLFASTPADRVPRVPPVTHER
ncbi:glutaminase A [Streptomyces sp. P9(2023)]|uniref:glutaminase A n=1 Tax=Streptomyces sp. P9(2023) TaxID=3064394 RepID=UPI0028F44F8E|nr:glutaminase A [Streptomyces sp. P9(2023)]MDT9692840.1 glutaminase A [Streptomyces sp. P9(2023)]